MRARRQTVIAKACLTSVTMLASVSVRGQGRTGFISGNSSVEQSGTVEASGSVLGSVRVIDGGPVAGAQVTLSDTTALLQQTLRTGANGEFAFSQIPPGTYFVTVHAKGFLPCTSAKFAVAVRQVVKTPTIQLSIAPLKTRVVVRPTEVIAEMQMKAEEKQRTFGIFPNFYTSYIWDAAPLNTTQKFSLAARDLFDPVSLLGVAATAGIEQANNDFAGYGRGTQGYGKRFGAAMGDELIGGFLSGAVFSSMFHQDPRYFYQGTGSVRSRLIHAFSWAVIARSDSGHPMPDYSDMLSDLAAGAISNLYYPRANRGVGLAFTNFGIGIASRAGEGLAQEFLLKRFTKHIPGKREH
jgi:Carboxypeptidase regulatory-like domain